MYNGKFNFRLAVYPGGRIRRRAGGVLPLRKQLDEMLDYLPEAEQVIIFEIVKRFVPDDVATADDLEAIQAARREYANGETVSHEAINWD